MQETPCIKSEVSKVKEDFRYKQKEAELNVSVMNIILTVAIFLISLGITIVSISPNVSKIILAIVFLFGLILLFMGLKGHFDWCRVILYDQERILSENLEKKSLNSFQQLQNDINGNDNININEENVCPLSSKDWISFLGTEITNLENYAHRDFNYIYPAFTIFVAILAILINSLYSTANMGIAPDGKIKIFLSILQGIVALNILFAIFVLVFIIILIDFLVRLKKASILRKIRNKVLEGSLKKPDKIHEEWKNMMQLKYLELLKMAYTRT
jgi:hypothetical protein